MNVTGVLLWGFAATLVLTTLLAGSVAAGLSRMSLPYILGTMVTPDRDRAQLYGFLLQLVYGWACAILYALAFEEWGRADWWSGAMIGVIHGLAVLTVALPVLPGLHPRMASEQRGPEPTRALEPPGFMGLHYGRSTPLATLIAHVVYGTILGGFYTLG